MHGPCRVLIILLLAIVAADSWTSSSDIPRISITRRLVRGRVSLVDRLKLQHHQKQQDATIPSLSLRSLQSSLSDSQSVTLSDYFNNEFVGSLGVGSPPQYFTVVFDTGSSDIWFSSSSCSTCGTHKLFKEDESTTFDWSTGWDNESAPFKISYGSGDVEGIIAADTVTLSGLTLDQVKLGVATSMDVAIASFDMDGICGLAFDGLAVVTKPSILDTITHTYPNLSHSFSIYLSSDPDDTTKPSFILFGGYDLSIVSEEAEFYYTPVIRDTSAFTYWTVSLTSFAICSSSEFTSADEMETVFSACEYGSSCLAIVDSGTSGIAIPYEYYSGIVSLVTGSLDCEDLTCVGVSEKDFPVLLLSLAPDNVFPLLPSDYLECSEFSECIVRFQESSDLWILGDAFMEAYYTHFDIENMRVGFACSGECSGGTWHGTGGYFVLTNEVSLWKRASFIYALFVLLLASLLSAINAMWTCIEERQIPPTTGMAGTATGKGKAAARPRKIDYLALNSEEDQGPSPYDVFTKE